MKFLYKKRSRKYIKDYKIDLDDIQNANTILFSIFGRYGDSIIGFAGSLELIEKYPEKNYIFITSPQNYPYIYDKTKNLFNVKIFTLKKDNIFKLLYILSYLKFNKPDLGFNPFSWHEESEFLISFAKKFSFFKNQKFNFYDNYYNIMRKYLNLSQKRIKLYNIEYGNNILICPESSEKRRSLTKEQLLSLIKKYKNKNIILAVNNKLNINVNQFIFSKKNSKKFLELVKNSELMIVVDSAPLHIGMLYDKNIIALFSSSSPGRVLNTNKKVFSVRNKILFGLECEDKTCKKAKCLDFIKNNIKDYYVEQERTQIIYQCPLREK